MSDATLFSMLTFRQKITKSLRQKMFRKMDLGREFKKCKQELYSEHLYDASVGWKREIVQSTILHYMA